MCLVGWQLYGVWNFWWKFYRLCITRCNLAWLYKLTFFDAKVDVFLKYMTSFLQGNVNKAKNFSFFFPFISFFIPLQPTRTDPPEKAKQLNHMSFLILRTAIVTWLVILFLVLPRPLGWKSFCLLPVAASPPSSNPDPPACLKSRNGLPQAHALLMKVSLQQTKLTLSPKNPLP